MAPTVIDLPSSAAVEAAKLKYWRKSIVKLTRRELGEATGYSVQAISLFEQGYDHRGRPLGARAWRRYRLVCAGLSHLRQQEARGRALHAWMTAQGYDE